MNASQPEPHEHEWHEASVIVRGAHGLHARPAIRFSRAARGYAARIQVRVDGCERWVDAKSVAKVMSLQVESGKTIQLRAVGDDAEAALSALRQLVEGDLANEDEDVA